MQNVPRLSETHLRSILMDGDCKGCASYHSCDLVWNNTFKACPCRVCIIKGICYEICDGFSEYYKGIFSFEPQEKVP